MQPGTVTVSRPSLDVEATYLYHHTELEDWHIPRGPGIFAHIPLAAVNSEITIQTRMY